MQSASARGATSSFLMQSTSARGAASWFLMQSTSARGATSWFLMQSASARGATSWFLLQSTSARGAASWFLLQSTSARGAASWFLLQSASARGATSWFLLQSLAAGGAASSFLMQSASAGGAASSFLMQSASAGGAASSFLMQSASAGGAASSFLLRSVAAGGATSWLLLHSASARGATSWLLLHSVSRFSSSLSYSVFGRDTVRCHRRPPGAEPSGVRGGSPRSGRSPWRRRDRPPGRGERQGVQPRRQAGHEEAILLQVPLFESRTRPDHRTAIRILVKGIHETLTVRIVVCRRPRRSPCLRRVQLVVRRPGRIQAGRGDGRRSGMQERRGLRPERELRREHGPMREGRERVLRHALSGHGLLRRKHVQRRRHLLLRAPRGGVKPPKMG